MGLPAPFLCRGSPRPPRGGSHAAPAHPTLHHAPCRDAHDTSASSMAAQVPNLLKVGY